MARSIVELKDSFPGDIWLIAGGPSAGYIDPEFFRGKYVISVNYAWKNFKADLVVVKESFALQDAVGAGQRVVASRYHCGSLNSYENTATGSWFVFDHLNNGLEEVDLSVISLESDVLVVSYSTITSALHLAAYMGARNIILIGHDCGLLDGHKKMAGYPKPDFQKANPGFYERFLSKIEPQTITVRDRLQEVYGCRIYSLNPFINFGLEGHIYERCKNG